jgi:hypothetical protein
MRLWATLTAIAGLIALATVFAFQTLPEVKAAGSCAANDAILRFEVARKVEDLDLLFGPTGAECRDKVVAAMDAVNTLDVRLFIPAYTAFVIFAALFLSGGALRPLTLGAIAAALVACVADYVETIGLLSYTPDLTPSTDELFRSSTAAWIKFAALAVNALLLAGLCFTTVPRRPIIGALLCLPVIGVGAMALNMDWSFFQTLAFLLSWVPLMIMAVKSAITGRA